MAATSSRLTGSRRLLFCSTQAILLFSSSSLPEPILLHWFSHPHSFVSRLGSRAILIRTLSVFSPDGKLGLLKIGWRLEMEELGLRVLKHWVALCLSVSIYRDCVSMSYHGICRSSQLGRLSENVQENSAGATVDHCYMERLKSAMVWLVIQERIFEKMESWLVTPLISLKLDLSWQVLTGRKNWAWTVYQVRFSYSVVGTFSSILWFWLFSIGSQQFSTGFKPISSGFWSEPMAFRTIMMGVQGTLRKRLGSGNETIGVSQRYDLMLIRDTNKENNVCKMKRRVRQSDNVQL